jgi:hypothetical protein
MTTILQQHVTVILWAVMAVMVVLLGPGRAQAQELLVGNSAGQQQTAFEWGDTVTVSATGLNLGLNQPACFWLNWLNPSNVQAFTDFYFVNADSITKSHVLPTGIAASGTWTVELWQANENCDSATSFIKLTAEFDVARTVIIGAGTPDWDGYRSEGGADATVKESAPTENFGLDHPLQVQGSSYGHEKRIFLRFDLVAGGIPNNSVIDDATVRLFMLHAPESTIYGKDSRFYRIYRNDRNWSEAVITWHNQPGRNIDVSGNNTTSTGTTDNRFLRWYNRKGDVQQFLDGDLDNDGWQIQDGESVCPLPGLGNADCDIEAEFSSTEAPNRARRPVLLIDWTPPTTEILVVKKCFIGGNSRPGGPFDFTGAGGHGLSKNFTLDCDGKMPFTITADGNYTISEAAPGAAPGSDGFGWEPRSVVCTDADTNAQLATGTTSVSFALAVADHRNITCTFQNYQAIMAVAKTIDGVLQNSGPADTVKLYVTNGSNLPGTPLASLSIPPTAHPAGPIGVPLTVCQEPVPAGYVLNKVSIYVNTSLTNTLTPGSAGPAPSGIYDPDPTGSSNRCFNVEIPPGTDDFWIRINDEGDTTPPEVTINQAATQADPTNSGPIHFIVHFSEEVSDFATGDVTISGTAGATTGTVTGSGQDYDVAVNDMTQDGTVVASIASGVAHDAFGNANNAATTTDATVSYDATKPTIAARATADGSPYAAGSWTRYDVVVSFSCADNPGGSGIATDTVAGQTVTAEGVTTSVNNTGACTDNAGNVADPASFGPIRIDKTPPSVSAEPDRPADHNGWYTSTVTVHFAATDGLSGVASCAPSSLYSGPDSATASVSGDCTDNAGNVGTGTFAFKYDATGPGITITLPADGAHYVLGTAHAADYGCSDAGPSSGIASCAGPVADGAAIDTSSLGSKSFKVDASDNAGNISSLTNYYMVDPIATTTTVSLSPGSVQYSDDVTFSADVSPCSPAFGGVTGSVQFSLNGSNVGVPVAIDRSCAASLTTAIGLPANSGYAVAASFASSNANYTNSVSVPDSLEVMSEDASATFNGNNAAKVESDGGTASFSFTVDVREINPEPHAGGGAHPGDIGSADLAVQLVPVGPGSPVNPDGGGCGAGAVTGTDYGQVKTYTCTFSNVEVNTYAVAMTINTGEYYEGYREDVLTVYDPSLGFTTGGGWFYWPAEDDDNPCAGRKTNFGYSMKYNKKMSNIQGGLLLICHFDDDSIYRMKSNALDGLALGDEGGVGWATFSGKATYQEPTMDYGGNHHFFVYVEDGNDPGEGPDRFWINLDPKDDTYSPVFNMALPAVDNAVVIDGGNIQVPHKPASSGGGGGHEAH